MTDATFIELNTSEEADIHSEMQTLVYVKNVIWY